MQSQIDEQQSKIEILKVLSTERARNPGNNQSNSFSFLYATTSSTAILSLALQMNGTGVSYGIDNIAIYTVPEPAAEMLLGFGGILLSGFGRRKAKEFNEKTNWPCPDCADRRF